MMNIESKRYQIKSTGFGGFTVINKQTNECKHVAAAPSSSELAAASEKQFDKMMEELISDTH